MERQGRTQRRNSAHLILENPDGNDMSVIEKFTSMEYGPAPEDPKESLQWLDRHKRRFGNFIGGAWKAPIEGRYFETMDPSTAEKIAEVAQGSAEDVDSAVKS